MVIAFQSRNRETFDSNPNVNGTTTGVVLAFQSRNRETFDSNELLLVGCGIMFNEDLFQSRNRETFDSNPQMANLHITAQYGMFQSRNRETFDSNLKETVASKIYKVMIVSIS